MTKPVIGNEEMRKLTQTYGGKTFKLAALMYYCKKDEDITNDKTSHLKGGN
jgi:hypothetical protein